MLNLPELTLPEIFLLASTIILTLLYLREYNLRKKLSSEGEKVLEEFKEKGLKVLHDSIKKSQALLGNSELEGVKVVAQAEYSSKKMEQQYAEKMQEIIQSSQNAISSAQSEYLKFIADLQTKSSELEALNQKSAEAKISQMFERLESRLSNFLISTEQQTISSIELEIKSARELVESYKEQQLSLIDENVIAMMEQTLNIVLSKKLSLKDQLDLVYEALEKAKVEKFIV